MPSLNGLDIARKLDAAHSATRIVLLTMHRDKKIFYAALDAGVQGYVLKDDAVSEIASAVTDVVAGEHFISKDLTRLLIEKAQGNAEDDGRYDAFDVLTSTEKKILSLVAEFHSNDEIASMLFISRRTVENHKANIADKLRLDGAKHLLRFALQNKEGLD
jgi:two-component system response regulator NreC